LVGLWLGFDIDARNLTTNSLQATSIILPP
jgi:hypothetical protein